MTPMLQNALGHMMPEVVPAEVLSLGRSWSHRRKLSRALSQRLGKTAQQLVDHQRDNRRILLLRHRRLVTDIPSSVRHLLQEVGTQEDYEAWIAAHQAGAATSLRTQQ